MLFGWSLMMLQNTLGLNSPFFCSHFPIRFGCCPLLFSVLLSHMHEKKVKFHLLHHK
uniref:Uncharacterized protein n=1 Tax=Rhizophora mucronata TaxID=61149 RepID=A0A2P2PXG6_RHIMU